MPATAKGLAERGARFEGAEALNYLDLFRAEPRARIRMVKAGLPAASAKRIISDLDMRGADAADTARIIAALEASRPDQEALEAALVSAVTAALADLDPSTVESDAILATVREVGAAVIDAVNARPTEFVVMPKL